MPLFPHATQDLEDDAAEKVMIFHVFQDVPCYNDVAGPLVCGGERDGWLRGLYSTDRALSCSVRKCVAYNGKSFRYPCDAAAQACATAFQCLKVRDNDVARYVVAPVGSMERGKFTGVGCIYIRSKRLCLWAGMARRKMDLFVYVSDRNLQRFVIERWKSGSSQNSGLAMIKRF